jgi:hypothetical protein
VKPVPRRSKSQKIRAQQLENLESRTLFSFSIGSITIPGVPNIPGLSTIPTLANLPITNTPINLGSLTGYLSPDPNDYWWLKNTGQTLSNPISGPATGTPGADVNAVDAWNLTQGSPNVVVAVLDTGIDLANPDLASVLWTNPNEIPGDGIDNDGDGQVDDIHGWNFLNNSNDVTDNFVHGTAVAATIHSVAPGVTILPVEIGTAAGADSADVTKGINYLIALKKEGVNIVAINASFISYTAPSMDEVNAIKNAGANGMLFIAAAGNASLNLDSLFPSVPSAFAKYIPSFMPSNMMFVAATDNQDNLASFSDYGAHTVAVGAPGVDITLPIPGGLYAPLSGTSFATPMVSAIAALLKSEIPTATADQIKTAILNSGDVDPALVGKTITGRRVDAFKALNYLIGNQPATGAVLTLNNDQIEGWAYEPNLGSAPATVQVLIDNVPYTFPANSGSDDTPDSVPSPDHGFSFDMPALGYGKHTVKVSVLDDTTNKATLIGSGTLVVDTAPIGALESTDNKTLTGWAADIDTPSKPTQVKFYLDNKPWVSSNAGIARPDLAEQLAAFPATNHGFALKLSAIPAGIHRLDAYAVDSLTGSLTLIGSSQLSSNRAAYGQVQSLTSGNIIGWAFDPDAGASAIQVRYQIDDFAPVLITANASRPDVTAIVGSKNHGFNITLPQLTAGDHVITVDAVDPNNKLLVRLDQETLSVANPDGNILPAGSVSSLTSSLVIGNVSEGDATGPISVRVDIDGKPGQPFGASAGDGSFSFTLPANLSPAAHRVDVYALDSTSGTPVLIDRDLVNYAPASAMLESFTGQSAAGWAIAPPPTARQTALVRVDIDGLTGALVTANLPRPDLQASLGTPSTPLVGFNINLPALPAGSHTATVSLIDPVTLTTTILGTLTYAST